MSGKSKDDFGHGSGKFITYMNVFSNPVASPNMTEAIEIDDSQNKVRFGDVLFTTSSETPDEVGIEYSARDCAPQPLKLSIHSGGIEHPCRCR